MASFAYQVRDREGRKLTGIIEGISERGVAEQLLQQGYLISNIKPTRGIIHGVDFFQSKISSDDLTMFYFQLSNMVEAGIPLVKAMETVSEQLSNRSLQKIIHNLGSRLAGGESLSESMSHHERVFSFLYRSMIRVGETSGKLAETLRHVAELNEANDELHHQIRSALAYPIVLIVASIAVVIFMMIWIVPSFTVIFNQAGVPLPLPTRIIFRLSLWVKSQPLVILGTLLMLVVGMRLLLRIRQVKYRWDQFWLSVPFVNQLIIRIEISRWSRNMMLMISSGVPILQTLEIAKDLTQNLVFQEILEATYMHVQGGSKLADMLQRSNVFPPDVVQMISTGENSGTLDKMLLKVAHFYDQLIARTLKKLTGMIEPVFILFMGGIVGFIMLSILLPIFDMIKLFSPH